MWFTFTMDPSGELPMYLSPGTMTNPAIAIYSGDCNNLKLIYNVIDHNCSDNDPANDNYPAILFDDLNPGETYFMRVWAEDGTSNGTFNISFDIDIEEIEFLVYADAINLADGCIQLTSEAGSQHGCAWYEKPIDFSQPFTHKMSANFGDKDADGADGICLVYQINGSDYCGDSGSGIGSGGMDNSVIIEFDTWQNGFLNDPVQDHSSININGDMDHNSSIDGPVLLGNIEDGADHEIEFSYDPGTNDYSVSFDGGVIMSGNYDFVNDVFGGETNVWWGYTASTGGYNNKHVICPEEPDPILLGTQEYIEDTICEGDDYNGLTEPGFYIDYIASGDCDHQINLLLDVIPRSDTFFVFDTICTGENYYFEGEVFDEAGEYEVWTTTDFGCDSLIVLTLDTLSVNIDVLMPDTLSCKNSIVTLTAEVSPNTSNIEFDWSGPEGNSNGDTWEVTKPGIYTLYVDIELSNFICSSSKIVVVEIDTLAPNIPHFKDVEFKCEEEVSDVIFKIDNPEKDVSYSWFIDTIKIGDSTYIEVDTVGKYYVKAYNNRTGCSAIDSFSILKTGNIPNIFVQNDTLTCDKTEIAVNVVASNNIMNYLWSLNGDSLSNKSNPTFDTPGIYEVKVLSNTGCSNSSTFQIFLDNEIPEADFVDSLTIPCNMDSTDLDVFDPQNVEIGYSYSWKNPLGDISYSNTLTATEAGIYSVAIKNTKNGCVFHDTILVDYLGKSPVFSIQPQTLTCNNTGYNIDVQVDSSNAVFNWTFENQFFSDIKNPYIDKPGNYRVKVTSLKGCESFKEFSVDLNIDTIQLSIDQPEKLTCSNKSVILVTSTLAGTDYKWIGPNSFLSTVKNPEVFEAGKYQLTILNPDNACPSTASITVERIGKLPDFYLEGGTLDCVHKTAELKIITDEIYKDILWTGPENYNKTNSKDILVSTSGEYTAKVVDENGCEKSLEFEIIDTTLYPKVILESDETINYELDESYDIVSKIIVDAENVDNIRWNPVKYLSCSDCLEPVFTSNNEENIDYTLTISNKQGCNDSLQLFARYIKEKEKVVITAPNIIIGDRNSNSENNWFTIYGHPVELILKINSLYVYDRWGELVFEKFNLNISEYQQGWDATFKGNQVASGVYVYYSEVLLVSGEVVKIYGDVTVVH